MSINYSSQFTITGAPRLNYLPYASSSQIIDLEQDFISKGMITDPATFDPSYGGAPMTIGGASDLIFKNKRGEISDAQLQSSLDVLRGRNVFTQVKKYLLQPATSQQHNLSFSGGNEVNTYYLSTSYSRELPITKGNSSDRITVLANNDFKFLKIFTLSTGMNMRWFMDKLNGIGLGAVGSVCPLAERRKPRQFNAGLCFRAPSCR